MKDINNNIIVLLSGAYNALKDFFTKVQPMVSKDGKELLADKVEKEKLFKALRNGDSEVETKYGTFNLH